MKSFFLLITLLSIAGDLVGAKHAAKGKCIDSSENSNNGKKRHCKAKKSIKKSAKGLKHPPSCKSNSHQCCLVIRSWALMGGDIPEDLKSSDNSCCTLMTGITCDSSKTKVKKIEWSWVGLSGIIPLEIFKLTSLTYL